MTRLLLIAAFLSGSAAGTPTDSAFITGEAIYRERIAAPPGTRFEAVLEDVSLADAPSVQIGKVVIDNAGQPPYRFSIAYNPEQIFASHTYVVRTALRQDGCLLFTSDTHTPVITRGNPTDVRIVMRQVAARGGKQSGD
jgi:uncharacterized lipoprotein YbaY